MARREISDEVWVVLEPLMPSVTGRSRPWTDHRLAVEGVVGKYRSGALWRDVPERFGNWNSICKRFTRWAADGTWVRLVAEVQRQSDAVGRLDWVVSIASTIEPPDHAIGRSRGGLTGKVHLVADAKGHPLS